MFGDHPFKDTKNNTDAGGLQTVPRCPICKSIEFDAHQNEFETFRDCRKCGNRWSGGSVGAARPDFSDPPPPSGVPAPDDDLPMHNFTGVAFRPWEE